jgi:hypothetical protein
MQVEKELPYLLDPDSILPVVTSGGSDILLAGLAAYTDPYLGLCEDNYVIIGLLGPLFSAISPPLEWRSTAATK